MKTRLFWTSTFLFAVCAVWLIPFIGILRHGTYTAQEPNLLILLGEIAMFLSLMVFALSSIAKSLRDYVKDKREGGAIIKDRSYQLTAKNKTKKEKNV